MVSWKKIKQTGQDTLAKTKNTRTNNKKIGRYMPLVLLCVCLTGCGENGQGPESKVIETDLINELAAYNDGLVFDEYSIEKSLTEDKTYSATVTVSAENNYSEHQLTAEINYVLYDQGWDFEAVDWTNDIYNVTSYPTADEMSDLIETTEELIDREMNIQQEITVETDEDSLSCIGIIEKTIMHTIYIKEK